MRRFFGFGLLLLAALLAGQGAARAQDWALNGAESRFYMQTAKNNAVIETHQFSILDGSVKADGTATVQVDLTSVASGIDVRDVRMRFLLFETFKFPKAMISAKLDMNKLRGVLTATRLTYPLEVSVTLHGVTAPIETEVFVTRLDDKTVSVATAKPIVVKAETFGLDAGVAKLSEAVGGVPIVRAASITFDLAFQTGDMIPEIEAQRTRTLEQKQAEETSQMSGEACQTRFSVISTAGSIFFRTGSAELDSASEPLLVSVAEIAQRCPEVHVKVTGHTDAVGSHQANQILSEERARTVATFLASRGVDVKRIEASGRGDTQPVVANDTEEHRAKNRRIEFQVVSE
ncbi:OmpA family protein [Labrys wisconsinensis]|uniref:Outer membrane protein OmpA-like peptidoglycan-associated protein n=1 Tax=Labrys wisconsinensis TaxID=425677 RepID=A0ABU0JDB4_9HYPH|nr:OmpA family protein [Labrys wisconsinensis]MDQ0472280.1 outer membrane protein OmpA-like peptidoglycan-associated protein [Labrys wisconsinensis]